MQARTSTKYTIDDIWPGLEEGLTHLLVNLTEGFSLESYMSLYTYKLVAFFLTFLQFGVQLLHNTQAPDKRGNKWC